jgi:phosphoglycolate phosphatase
MRFKHVIFDFDGTITDSRRDIAGAQVWALRQIGIDTIREEELYRYIGKPLRATFSAVLPPSMHDRIDEAEQLYSGYYPARSLVTTQLFPGVRETLEELRLRGTTLAVASTKRGGGVKRATDYFGITHYFVRLQGSDGIPFKPDPTILRIIMTDLKWDPAETLMVGDTDNDVLAGKNAGIATCAVTYGSLSAGELQTFAPDYMVHEFPSLLSIVG